MFQVRNAVSHFFIRMNSYLLLVFLQVTGHTSVLAAALVIPFLLMAAISSIITINVASKFVLVRPVFLAALAVLPVGMVSWESRTYLISANSKGFPLKGLMSTLNEASPIGQIVGYSLICGVGFGSVSVFLLSQLP